MVGPAILRVYQTQKTLPSPYTCHDGVLTAAQITAFVTDADQMGMPQRTINQLANEGIASPSDLVDFEKDTLAMVAENLRHPGGREPNPDPNAAPGERDR